MTILANLLPAYRTALEPQDAELVGPERVAEVQAFLSARLEYAPTPLLGLPRLAEKLGVGAIHLKDERARLGLKSFKALGGSFAVARLVADQAAAALGHPIALHDLDDEKVRRVAATLTFACATDGNHGMAVAYGAKRAGAACVIFLHSGVSEARAQAIATFGAELRRVRGHYDDAVAEAARCAARHGWTELADTARPGYERIPALVMQGYGVLIAEADRQLVEAPTHVFVQAGVGGLAGTVAAQSARLYGAKRPTFVVVEPARAACIAASVEAKAPIQIPAREPTIMAMLECYKPSLIAWRILSRAADFFMTIEDEEAVAAMNALARPVGRDPAIAAGESGAAGLGGLLCAAASRENMARLGLDRESRILLIATEGATDPERYRALTGLGPDQVRRSRRHG